MQRKFAIAGCLAAIAFVASCATSRIVGTDVKNLITGKPMDNSGLSRAVSSDTNDVEKNLEAVRKRVLEAYAQLRSNVSKRWGRNETKVAERTVYVKYTQGYTSRVITDFDRGTFTVETVDEKDPQGSLKATLMAALLTSSDPSTVDLFSDKAVSLDTNRRPYLYGLIRDNNGQSISTRQQADRFATYLLAHKVQTRPVTGEEGGGKLAHFVRLSMVKNFEAQGAARYRPAVDKYSKQYHVSPSLVMAVIRTESNFNPFAVSGAPAYGLMQLVPTSGGREAYKRVAGTDETPTTEYLFDPDHSIELGTAYLGLLADTDFHAISNQDSRDYCVIAAYNTGAGNVTRTFARNRKEALENINGLDSVRVFERLRTGLPAEETRQYVVKVTGHRKEFAGGTAVGSGPAPAAAASARTRAPAQNQATR